MRQASGQKEAGSNKYFGKGHMLLIPIFLI